MLGTYSTSQIGITNGNIKLVTPQVEVPNITPYIFQKQSNRNVATALLASLLKI